MIGLYREGGSLLHRAPAGAKLLALLVFTTALVIVRTPQAVAGGLLIVLVGYAVGGLSPRVLWEQVRPLRWFVVMLVPLQWWLAGPAAAVVSAGTLVVAVAAAGLVTVTTRTTELLAVIERVLRPLPRVDADRVALLLILTIRAIPVLTEFAREVAQARRARGMERSVRALVVPMAIRTIGHAERLGDALVARGLDD